MKSGPETNMRYTPFYMSNETHTFTSIQKHNGMYFKKADALMQRNKSGEAPIALLVMRIQLLPHYKQKLKELRKRK